MNETTVYEDHIITLSLNGDGYICNGVFWRSLEDLKDYIDRKTKHSEQAINQIP